MSDAEKNSRLLFVIGAPRSGTYLLTVYLTQQLSLAIPVETHFIPLFERYLYLWGNLKKKCNRERLLQDIYDFLEIWTPRSERGRDWKLVRELSLLGTRPLADIIAAETENYSEIINSLYRKYAELHNRGWAGDKSAFYFPLSPEKIKQIIPETMFVHMVRDGRDVSLSWRNMWFGPLSVTESAWLWRKHVLDRRRWGKNNPESYFEIYYEKFIDDPEKQVNSVAEYFGIGKAGQAHSASGMREMLAEGPAHSMLSQAINPANKDKWKDDMSKNDLAIFEFWAGDALREMGYPVVNQEFSWLMKIRFYIYAVGAGFMRLISWRHFRLRIKNVLPLLIWISNSLKIPLVRIVNAGLSQ